MPGRLDCKHSGFRSAIGLRQVMIMTAVLALSACGFHLRGAGSQSLSFESIRLECPSSQSRVLCSELQRRLQDNGVKLSSSSNTSLKIDPLNLGRRAVSLTSTASAAEYELTRSTRYTLRDELNDKVISSGQVQQRQSYHYDESNVLAKSREESNILESLDSSLAASILNRISAQSGGSSQAQ